MFVRPEEIVKEFNLNPGMIVADFGCGSGFYTFAAAKIVGKPGIVYGVDVQKDLLQTLKKSAELQNLTNVEIIWADLEIPEGTHLKNESVDFIIVSNILFQVEKKQEVIKEIFRILKKGGKAAIIEWDKSTINPAVSATPGLKMGPPMQTRISKQDAKDLFSKNGLLAEKEFEPGDNHYGIIFRK